MLQFAMEDDMKTWREKEMGIKQGHCVSNLSLADDVLFLSSSLNQLKKMMSDFMRSTENMGLKIHPDTTNIFPHQKTTKQREAHIDNINVENLTSPKGTNCDVRKARDGRKAPTGIDVKIPSARPETTLIRRCHHAVDIVRLADGL